MSHMNDETIAQVIASCVQFIKSELDEHIILPKKSNRYCPVQHLKSKNTYDCKRELYQTYTMDCFPEPVPDPTTDYNIVPRGGMIYINNARDILPRLMIAMDYNNGGRDECEKSIRNAEMLTMMYDTNPYILFVTGNEQTCSSLAELNGGILPYFMDNTDYMTMTEEEEKMANIIDTINVVQSNIIICVKSDRDWTEYEMKRICYQVVRKSVEYYE